MMYRIRNFKFFTLAFFLAACLCIPQAALSQDNPEPTKEQWKQIDACTKPLEEALWEECKQHSINAAGSPNPGYIGAKDRWATAQDYYHCGSRGQRNDRWCQLQILGYSQVTLEKIFHHEQMENKGVLDYVEKYKNTAEYLPW